jgi:cell division transport system permease protein
MMRRMVVDGQTSYLARTLMDNVKDAAVDLAAGVGVSTICLFLLGGLALLFFQIAPRIIPMWMNDGKIVAYLHSNTSPGEAGKILRELSGLNEIAGVRYVSREDARHGLEKELGEFKGLLGGMKEDLLPPSLEIEVRDKVTPSADIDEVIGKIRGFQQVEEVFYGKSWLDKLESISGFLKPTGLAVVLFLVFLVVMVISGKLKRTLADRRDELSVLELVGAGPFYIKVPYYVEGILVGAVSATLAIFFLFSLLSFGLASLPIPLAAALSLDGFTKSILIAGVLSSGVALGLLGSWLALRRSVQA